MSSVKIPSRYNDDASYLSGPRSAGTSRPASGATSHGGRPISAATAPTPPPINPVLLTSNPASTSQAAYAAAAAGEKLLSLFHSRKLPLICQMFVLTNNPKI